MKKGWSYKKLGEVCNIDFGTRVVRSRDAGSIYPVYGGGGATFKMDTYNREDCMVISRFGMSEQCTRFVKGKFFLNDSGLTLSMKKDCMIQGFMDWQIVYLNNTIYSLGRGAAQKNLDTKALAEVVIVYPNNLSEQLSIVSRLDAAFAHIDALKANAEKQLAEARQLFQKLSDDILQNEYWEKTTLHEICKQITDGTHRTPHYISKGVPFLSVKNVTSGFIDFENTKFISEEEHSEFVKRCNPTYGDILYTKVGTTGVAKVIDVKQKFSIFVSLALLKIEDNLVYNKFLEYVLNSPYVYKQSQKLTSGAANRNFLLNDIKKVELFLPSINTQHQIVSRLDALSANIKKLEELQRKTLAECDALKQAMLREVFE